MSKPWGRFCKFCGLLRKTELYVPVATWFSKKKFQGKKRPQKSMTIGSPEILTKREKEKKQRTSAGHHFLNPPKNEFSTGFITFHGTYNSLQVIFNEIHELFYQLDQNCGVDAYSG